MISKKIFIFAILLLVAFNAFAQPANNTPCTAQTVDINTGCQSGTNVGANANGYTGSCWLTTASHTVWFKITATDDTLTISTDYAAMTLTDSQIAVYSSSNNACNGTFTQVGCDEDGGVTCALCSELVLTSLVVGNTYFIAVDGYFNSTGTFCVSVTEPLPSSPDFATDCELSHQIYQNNTCDVLSGNIGSATTMPSTNSVDQPCSAQNDASQPGYWSTFTANSTTSTIDPADFTGAETTNWYDVTVYSGSCTSLSSVDCRSVNSKNNDYAIATTVGTTYYVFMTQGSSYTSANPILQMCILGAACTPPSNNSCGSAMSIMDGTIYSGTNACATADLGLCSGSTENNVWYSWTAPASWVAGESAFVTVFNQDCYDIDPTDPSPGVQVSVYKATETCATISGTSTECAIFVNPNDDENFYGEFFANPNQTYLINIDGFGGDACTYDIQVNDDPIPLPIELLSFTAKADMIRKSVQLEWAVAGEKNNSHFIVERSQTGLNFEPIAEKQGLGNSGQTAYYSTIDPQPFSGMNYYRLKQVDLDGQFVYSHIVPVKMKLNTEVTLYPNPAEDELTMDLYSEILSETPYTIQFFNSVGNLAFETKMFIEKGENQMKFDLKNLSSGLYMILIKSESENIAKPIILR